MDEYEHALRHNVADPVCNLVAEAHSTLIYNLRTVPFTRHSAKTSLTAFASKVGRHHKVLGHVELGLLLDSLDDFGSNWERAPLRHGEGRDGWEESLVGCLRDVSLHCPAFHA